MAPMVAVWAIDSTRMTPGTIGLPGKWPAWYHSFPVKVCSATTRTTGSSSVTRSIKRNGSRCGMMASIAALSSVDIASESRDKEGDHLAVVPFTFSEVVRLRSELGDAGRPVAARTAQARSVGRSGTGTEDVVAAAADLERSKPIVVSAGVRDVLARDPNRVPVDRRSAVVAPTGARDRAI